MKNYLFFSSFIFISLWSNAQDIIQAKGNPTSASSLFLKYKVDDSIKGIQSYSEIRFNGFSKNTFIDCFNGAAMIALHKIDNKKALLSFSVGRKPTDSVSVLSRGLHTNEKRSFISFEYYLPKDTGTFKTLVTAIIDSASNTGIYTGYVFLPKEKQWKLLGTIRKVSIKKNKIGYLNEDLIIVMPKTLEGTINNLKVEFGGNWIQRENGTWKELTEINYRSTLNTLLMVNDNKVVLSDTKNLSVLDTTFKLTPTNQRPNIDVTKHVDSAEQYTIDIKTMAMAVADKKIDTTGSVNGVYYKILKEGTGEFVNVNDTVTCYYKGSLLSDGSVFDATKDNKPATFHLKRLIKGWQIGLAKCKVGGTIRLIIPSALAYSIRSRSKAIPPNSILVFDIEVLGVKHEK